MLKKKKKTPQSVVADKAEQATEVVSDAASQLKSVAQDTAQQAGDQAKQAAQAISSERGKTGGVLALLLLIVAGALYWKSTNAK